jgi:hypothetical protein
MSTPELREAFENELRRVLIQNHPNFSGWYSALTARTRQAVDIILDEDVTPELIYFSQDVVQEEGEAAVQFMLILAGGNPSPQMTLALTNIALGDILIEVRAFQKREE